MRKTKISNGEVLFMAIRMLQQEAGASSKHLHSLDNGQSMPGKINKLF